MIKTILVPAPDGAGDPSIFAAALAVARPFAAHIDALHVRPDPVEVAVTAAGGDGGGVLIGRLVDQIERDTGEREAKAHAAFAEFCTREGLPITAAPSGAATGPSAQWHVETGREERWTVAYGIAADLVVAARGGAGEDAAARSTLEAVLIGTGRPLLIPGPAAPAPAVADTVAIAWKPTPQAARAVASAMPFLARAKAIVVLTVEEESAGGSGADRLVRHLAWHGIAAAAERLAPGPEDPAETLLAAAGARAGLLVMGGYGHARLREWVFGGFTQRALSAAPLAVLLAH